MIYGLFHLPLWAYIVITIVFTQLTILSVTIFLHRCQAHRALTLHPLISHVFRFWLWLATGMNTKEWVAVHRKHHAKVETQEDPHSPQIYGIVRVFFAGAGLYRKSAKEEGILDRYGVGTPDDWMERNVYGRFDSWGIFLMLAIDIVLFGWVGLVIWAIQMAWLPLFAQGVINGIGHFWGYRNFASPDTSRNVVPWGFLIGGEELHNNHHAFATSAKLSSKWWEFDIGWLWIRILMLFKLANVRQAPVQLKVDPEKSQIDMEVVRALISHRIQVMDRYFRQVVIPVIKEEKKKACDSTQKMFNRARRMFRANEFLLKAKKRKVTTAIEHNAQLQVIYQFQNRLQALWQRTAEGQKDLLEYLQEWCKQAEASRINALVEFARQLKQYSLQPVRGRA